MLSLLKMHFKNKHLNKKHYELLLFYHIFNIKHTKIIY